MITPKQHLLTWLNKKDAIPDYAKTNHFHVMWSGSVIDIHDGRDLVNVGFQSKHLKRIIAGLEMSGLFKKLHRNVKFFYYECNLSHWEFFYS